jgi:hypothetical protein
MTDQHLFSEGETAWLLGQPTKTSENTGAHWCATETGYVIYESRLELPRLSGCARKFVGGQVQAVGSPR